MSSRIVDCLIRMDPSRVIEPELVDVAAATTAVVGAVVPAAEIAGFFDRSFPRLTAVLSGQGITIEGPAFALYHGQPAETVDIEVGFVANRPVQPEDGVRAGSLPGGRVARLVHQGGYDQLQTSWERLRLWIEARDLTPSRDLWEVYVTEPSPDMDPAELRTELNWPVRP
jgi:effector-binding domain-containing protein